MSDLRVVTLVPRRSDGGHRDRLWEFARAQWEASHPDYPVFEGHHEKHEGPFNRSAGINRGSAAAGDWDVALIIDGDVIPDPDAVRRAVDFAARTNRMTVSHTRRVMLGRKMTEAILDGYKGNWEKRGTQVFTDSCSCCIAVSRTLWDLVGGFDEEYVGWGFEDSAFGAMAIAKTGPIQFIDSTLFHLWHPESPEANPSNPLRRKNELRLRALHQQLGTYSKKPPIPEADTGAMIPRVLHRTVPTETTAEVEAWWDRFQAMHPGWQFRTYRDPIDPALFPRTSPLWARCENGAQKAGLIRLEALVTHGGVYVDSDVEPFRPFDPLLGTQAFCAWEDESTIPDAVLGARAHHPAFEQMLDEAIDAVRRKRGAWESGPGVTTRNLPGRNDVLCLPPGAFYPYHYLAKSQRTQVTPESMPWVFCVHHWHGSWLSEAQRTSIESNQR